MDPLHAYPLGNGWAGITPKETTAMSWKIMGEPNSSMTDRSVQGVIMFMPIYFTRRGEYMFMYGTKSSGLPVHTQILKAEL